MHTTWPALSETGRHLPGGLRRDLEDGFGADLRGVRVHTGPIADRVVTRSGASALAVGTDILFADGAFDPERRRGRWLLAHEVAHVVQQGRGLVTPRARGDRRARHEAHWERDADRAATAFVSGREAVVGVGVRVPRPRPTRVVQRHDSFEHRLLGDVPTDDLVLVAGTTPARVDVLTRQLRMIDLWQHDPTGVTEAQVNEVCPWIRTVRLGASGLLVTYGELNALPDYIATGDVADTIPAEVLLPILQFIRQESDTQLRVLLGAPDPRPFAGAVMPPSIPFLGFLDKILQSSAIDTLTRTLGVHSTDHYLAILARNACHFAPFSWHRWQHAHTVARGLATQANQASDPGETARLTHAAWLQAGYADHFLQDSFAAGHLVNKTLIMQWFVEWVGSTGWPVADWDNVARNTVDLQPDLAGRKLYDPDYQGLSNDPQTAEDQPDYAARLATADVVAAAGRPLDASYQDYLSFLDSLVVQSSSAAIHDHWNTASLWVGSSSHPEAFEIWGDDTLFSGTNAAGGVEQTSAATQLAQEAIQELLARGTTDISVQQVRDRFPTSVRSDDGMLSLESWNETQRQFCGDSIFPYVHEVLVRLFAPRATAVSVDQDLTPRWNTSLPGTGFEPVSVLALDAGPCVASNGSVFALDRQSGAVLHSAVLGSGDTRLAASDDGTGVFVGVGGRVARISPPSWSAPAWTTSLPHGSGTVTVLAAAGMLFASSNGYVHRLDPTSGAMVATYQFSSSFGSGDYTASLAVRGGDLVVGSHGWVYALPVQALDRPRWSSSLPGVGYQRVAVLDVAGGVIAGTNGHVFDLDGDTGRVRHDLLVTSQVGVGDYSTSLATDGATLVVGVHGWVYGLRLDDWSRTTWATSLPDARWTTVEVACHDGQVLAGSYGYLFRLDGADGHVVRSLLLASVVGVGDYETRLLVDGDTALLGIHGYAYAVSLVDPPVR